MRLRASMDSHSTVTRIGADEFAFLYPLVFSEDAAADKARMLIEIFRRPMTSASAPRAFRRRSAVRCSISATRRRR